MTYFGSKVRSCPTDIKDIEMTLLKLTLRSALITDLAVSYDSRIWIIKTAGSFVIARTSEPDKAIDVPLTRIGDAIDRFIDGFVYESESDLTKIVVHLSNDPSEDGVSWGFIRSNIPGVSMLLNQKHTLKNTLSYDSNTVRDVRSSFEGS